MNPHKTYTLAYSSCPNDTFIFKAVARNLITRNGMEFNITLEDVETLNQNALNSRYDVTKLSFAAFGQLADRYALLRTGAALGLGCGPLIISLPGHRLSDTPEPAIAVPGLMTTAYHLFRFYMDDLFPGIRPRILPMPFEKIMPAVLEKKADFGVIIHEGRFVYREMGLEMKADLGEWWEKKTGLPIPLGCIAVKRDRGSEFACDVQEMIGQSIDHAFSHPELAFDYIKTHAQEMAEDVIQQHISLYVNDFSKDIGSKGTKAVETFFKKAGDAGLINLPDLPLFAC